MTQENNFISKNEIKWCPGCGNYPVLSTIHKTFLKLQIKKENTVFVSGIGCAGRFPYYINTYGFHTLHGRAPAIATGLKLSNENLNVWVVIGDGDGFSIGLNHTLHLIRRNINIKILFINNKIYSLTKGQYSPTSENNFISKSSPYGSIENPINPMLLTLSVGVSFAARSLDNDIKNLTNIISEAYNHNGTAFIEILQNCNIFNDGIFSKYSEKNKKFENTLMLENNKPLLYGENNDKALIINNNSLQTISSINNEDKFILYNNETDNIIQLLLAKLGYNQIPLPIGILKKITQPTYESVLKSINKKTKAIYNINNIFEESH